MASNAQSNGIPASTTHSRTPPAPPLASTQQQTPTQQPPQQPQPPSTAPPPETATATTYATTAPPQPADATTNPRPHDARTIHLILASLGLTSYQDRVPLQLLDLAYRYSSSILSDAAHLAAEGYTMPDTTGIAATGSGGGGNKRQKASNEGDVTLAALRLATSSRVGHSFAKGLPKSAMLGVAEERNRVRLPDVSGRGAGGAAGGGKVFGVRLPEERFLLSGRGWGLSALAEDLDITDGAAGAGGGDASGASGEENEDEGEGMDEDGEGGFKDVFGEGDGEDEGGGERGDEDMGEG